MQKRSYFMLGIELYMEDFLPSVVYAKLGLRPNECKIAKKEAIILNYKEWKKQLEKYEKSTISTSQNNAKSTQNTQNTLNDIKIEETNAIKGFYKIHSKIFNASSFRKECDRFISKLEKKKKTLLSIKQSHNAFIVLRIYAFVNKKDFLGLNLSTNASRFCASVNARILTQIKVL
ncbi:DUF4279 domain-containing protein [Helicobacter sp. T3_23-1056]